MNNKSNDPVYPYHSRELSWLDFNVRVLEEACKKNNPLLERLRFLGITASNLDEFFMVRVPFAPHQINLKHTQIKFYEITEQEELKQINSKIHDFVEKQYSCLHRSIIPMLQKKKIEFTKISELDDKQFKHIANYYKKVVFPVLTPLAVDTSRPFPLLSNRSLNIAVLLQKPSKKDDNHQSKNFAIIQVPSILPRFLELPRDNNTRKFVLLEDIIMSNLNSLFEFHKIESTCLFRITRNSDLEIDEDGNDLLEEVQKSIKKRKRGTPVRLEIIKKCDTQVKKFLIDMIDVTKNEIYEVKGPIDLSFFTRFANLRGCKALRFDTITPVFPPADFVGYDNIFKAIREKDLMVHHPYESFDFVVNFVQQAANDKAVLAIKQTLYRVSGHSPIIAALIKAAENGKQVTVLVELKARFDEENNILWAKKLERAGCHVIYGLTHLKTHCKILLVVRREDSGIRRYLHLGTGNYNETTAKTYTDIGLFTCKEDFGIDASSFFNFLTGYSRPPEYKKLIVAPTSMRSFFENKINNEIANARANLPSGITVKINSLVDPWIIHLLYTASCAGVKINLIIRGICCLIPKVKNISENINVISIVGQFLEHSRIFRFESAGNPEVYMGSADWMPRNLDRRVELIFPVEDEHLKQRLFDILEIILSDTTNAHIQLPSTKYMRIDKRGKKTINSQLTLMKIAKNEMLQKKQSQQHLFEE